MLRTVHLHGALKRKFKHAAIKLDADNVAEAVRGLSVLLPGFASYIRDRQYLVTVANDQDELAIEPEALLLNLGSRRHIHIIPAAQAAGFETVLIVGLVLVAAVSIATVFLMRPKVPDANSRERKDQSFIFDGALNSTEQGNVVPIIYGGPIRVGSLVVSAGISTTDVAASALAIGSGGGYVGSSPGVLGGSGGGGGRIWDVDSPIRAFKGGKSGGGSRAAEESPNTLRSQATVKIVDLVGEGEIGGLVNGLKSAYLDDTPVENPDGSFNFSGYSLEERLGLPDQDPMPGFSQQENGVEVSQDVTNLTPIVRTISDPVVDVVRVTLSVTSLFQQDTKNGDLKPTSVQLAIDHQSDGGGYTTVVTDTIQGKTNSPYQRSYDIRLDGPAPHNIRVRRITPDSELTTLQNATRWDSYFEIVEAKLIYPDSALYGVTVDAKQFGSNIPVRSYEVYGLVIDIPTNYDPVTRTYTGIWDGTFKRAVCNNPAWVLYDIIRNNRYGLGSRVPVTSIDKYGLYAVAQYCDGLVSDGHGGMQPRYTINACINSPESAYNVLASIASAFRGFVYWGSGSVYVTQDRPEDPSLLVTRANVVDGRLSYQTVVEKQKLRSVAIVYWNDPNDNYRLVPEIVEDDELIRRIGWEPQDSVVRFGCTNRAEAHYAARWMLDDQKYANKAVKYEAADDHSFVHPGSIASVSDPKFTLGRRGGRVAAGSTTTTVNLDAPVTLAAGQTYSLRVILTDGSVVTSTVTSAAGTRTALNLASTMPSAPAAGSVWALESDTVANRQFRIRSATADEPPYSVFAVLHDPLSHDRVEQGVDLTPANFIDVPTGPLAIPTELSAVEFLLNDGTAASPAVQFSWQSSPDPRILFYQARYKRPGGDWETLEDSSALARVIRNSEAGTWGFMVRAVDGLGRKTAWASGTIDLDGQVDAMPEVSGVGLVTNPTAFTAKLVWNAPNDRRPLRYDILLNRASTTLSAAEYLGTTDMLEWPITEPGHYWIRTRFINVVSPTPPRVDVGVPDIDFLGDFGDLATLDKVLLGSGGQVLRQDGVTPVTDSTAITSLGTSAGIAGQGALATQNSAAWGSQITGRPTELTDGRITSGLDGSGNLQSAVKAGGSVAVSVLDLLAFAGGTNLAKNPEFVGGSLTGHAVYNNAGGSKVTISAIADSTAPNGSGYFLRVTYDGTGIPDSNPTPGFGGVVQTLSDGVGSSKPGFYARGTVLIMRVKAKISVGRTLNFATNGLGTGGGYEYLTNMAGTGNWQDYLIRVTIGGSGTFGATGYLWVSGGSNALFSWDLARYDQVDVTSSRKHYAGNNFLDENGIARFAADIVTAAGVATGITGQGALATQNTVTWLSQITGSGKPQDNATVGAAAGVNLLDGSAGSVLALAAIKTILGTSAGFTGQGALATLNAVGPSQISVPQISAIAADLGIITSGLLRSATSSTQLDLNNNRLLFNNGSVMMVVGVGFGSANQFILWFGPTQSNFSLCTEANATFYLKTNGSAYFGGSLSAGTLTTKAATSSLSATASIDTGAFGSNGHQIQVTLSYNHSNTTDATYPATSAGLSNFMAQVAANNATSSDGFFYTGGGSTSESVTVTLYRDVGSGFTQVTQLVLSAGSYTWTGTAPVPADSAPGSSRRVQTLGGSTTFNDPSLSTVNRNYRATITARSVVTGGSPETQTTSIVAVEQ